jgi:hypothetical protein
MGCPVKLSILHGPSVTGVKRAKPTAAVGVVVRPWLPGRAWGGAWRESRTCRGRSAETHPPRCAWCTCPSPVGDVLEALSNMTKRIAPSEAKAQALAALLQGHTEASSGEELLSILVQL